MVKGKLKQRGYKRDVLQSYKNAQETLGFQKKIV